MSEYPTGLETRRSSIGETRRLAMLADLVGTMRVVHRRRRRRRVALATVLTLAVATGLSILVRSGPFATPTTGTPPLTRPVTAGARLRYEVVATDPGILDRYAPRSATHRIEIIDDDTLLTELAAIDRPAGLIRYGDRIWLSAPVTGLVEDG